MRTRSKRNNNNNNKKKIDPIFLELLETLSFEKKKEKIKKKR